MKIKKCRNCNTSSLSNLFSLGNLSFTGKFFRNGKKVKSGKISLLICNKCKLVQLDKNFNLNYLYNKDYGYRSGINKTMKDHLKKTAEKIEKLYLLRKNDLVLDIASNDGTLLNSYKNKKIIKIGIDPILNKFKQKYKNIDFKFANFFDLKKLNHKIFRKKFKVITALSVFYDLKNPNLFLKDITKILDQDGIIVLEFADLGSILKNNMFDTICHEHLEYYSINVIRKMLKKHGLKIFNYNINNINGGSSVFYICFEKNKNRPQFKDLNKIISLESKLRLDKIQTYKKFFKKIKYLKNDTIKKLDKILKKNKIIHGYGASTKGNVLLQFFELNKHFKYISDRNPEKNGLQTPGTNIKIISEKQSRDLSPDYYFVLPWHFKKEILLREKGMRLKGTKFIFPLPKFEII